MVVFGPEPTIDENDGRLRRSTERVLDQCLQFELGIARFHGGNHLGAFIGAAIKEGRDKLTVALSPRLASLGLWIEQLIAEDTGKHVPARCRWSTNRSGPRTNMGHDRAFVAIPTEKDAPD